MGTIKLRENDKQTVTLVEVVEVDGVTVVAKENPIRVNVELIADMECVIAQDDPDTYIYQDTEVQNGFYQQGFAYAGTGKYEGKEVYLFCAGDANNLDIGQNVFMVEVK